MPSRPYPPSEGADNPLMEQLQRLGPVLWVIPLLVIALFAALTCYYTVQPEE